MQLAWPAGKRFAFTVFDDTDSAILANVREVYALLLDHGLVTTKSVWALRETADGGRWPGETLDDPAYVAWLRQLQAAGVEIGYHGAACHSSRRDDIIRGLQRFADRFGAPPRTFTNHSICRENVYWGSARLSGWRRGAYNLLTRGRHHGYFSGHLPESPYFWGDLCAQQIDYVRNFIFQDINTLRCCPLMPYHDPTRPYVRAWFASTDGATCARYTDALSEANQDRLEAEGGACIMYTHFASGFYQDGQLDPRFRQLMKRLSEKNGWFVPVATLLDYLRQVQGLHGLSAGEQAALERRWFVDQLASRLGHRHAPLPVAPEAAHVRHS